MFPDIQNHKDREHRVDIRVVLFDLHDDGPARLFAECERCPARALGANRRLRKHLFEPLEGAELLFDHFRDFSGRLLATAVARRGEVFPEQRVQQVPPDVEREFLESRLGVEIGLVGSGLVHL